MDEKKSTMEMYGFEPGAAFDLFDIGLDLAFVGKTAEAIHQFEESIKVNPDIPATHMYLVMLNEFAKSPPEYIKGLCEGWLDVAKRSNNEKQIKRAQYCLDYYSTDDEGRKKMTADFAKSVKKPEPEGYQ